MGIYNEGGEHTLCKTITNGVDGHGQLCKFWDFREREYSTLATGSAQIEG